MTFFPCFFLEKSGNLHSGCRPFFLLFFRKLSEGPRRGGPYYWYHSYPPEFFSSMVQAPLYAVLSGRAVLVHDCTSDADLEIIDGGTSDNVTARDPKSPCNWPEILLQGELAVLVLSHVNARVLPRVCHAWCALSRCGALTAHHNDVHCMQLVGACGPTRPWPTYQRLPCSITRPSAPAT